jgi:PAS domain S-box-containing protein
MIHESDVLIVEDNPASLKAISEFLRLSGLNVRAVPRGEPALRALEKAPADLILLDINLPDINGFEVCRKLKSEEKLSGIPVIFITGSVDSRTRIQAFAVGGVDYITKPYNMEEVLARVTTHLDLYKTKKHLDELVNSRTAELRKSEQLYRTLAANFPNGAVTLFDFDLRYQIAAGSGLAKVGLSSQAMEGKTIRDVFPPETFEAIEPDYRAALAGKSTISEVPFGGRIYYTHTLPVRDDHNEIIAGMVVTQDITGQKKAEQEIDKNSIIINSTTDAIITTDVGGTITFWNRGAELMYGYKKEEALGKPISMIYKEEHLHTLESTISELLQGKDIPGIEVTCIDKNRNDVDILLSLTTIKDKAGNITELVGITKDITQRKRMEKELHTTQMHYTDFINHTSDIVSYWKMPDGLKVDLPVEEQVDMLYHSTCIDANRSSWESFRLKSKEELIGTKFIDLIRERSYDQNFKDFINNGYKMEDSEVHKIPKVGDDYYGLDKWFGIVEDGMLKYLWLQSRDITEQKKAELALKKSEEGFKYLANSIDDIFFAIDKNFNYTFWNDACHRFFGKTSESMIGKSYYDSQYNKNYEWTADIYKEVMQTGKSRTFEVEFDFRNQTIWLDIKAYPSQTGCAVLIKDITERKQQEALLDARLRFSEISTTTDSVEELTQTFLDAAEKLTGSEIGFFHSLDEDQVTLRLQTWSTNTLKNMCTAEGKGMHYPVEEAGVWVDCVKERSPVIHNDYAALPHKKGMPEGHVPVIRELVVPIIREGNISAILGVGNKKTDYRENDIKTVSVLADLAWDIIVRKRAEEALRESEEKFRTLTVSSPVGIFLDDAQGNATYINEKCAELVGVPAEKALDLDWVPLIHPDDRERVTTEWFNAVKNGEEFHQEYRWVHAGGKVVWTQGDIVPVKASTGEITVFIGTLTDITERKQAEEELRKYRHQLEDLVQERTDELEKSIQKYKKSQKAMLYMVEDLNKTTRELKAAQDQLIIKERLAVLGQFSGNISHELRNPLGVIGSSAYYLKTVLADCNEKVKAHLQRIDSSVNSAGAIIQSLLDLTRMEKPTLSKNELAPIIAAAVKSTNISAGIEVVQDIEPETLAIKGDMEQIRMALKNIIKNGVESIETTGSITIHAANSGDGFAEITINDSGCGIAADDLNNIFQPLFSTKTHGIGYGLSITKMIIDNHEGTINVESIPGKGTDFIVKLPLYHGKEG